MQNDALAKQPRLFVIVACHSISSVLHQH